MLSKRLRTRSRGGGVHNNWHPLQSFNAFPSFLLYAELAQNYTKVSHLLVGFYLLLCFFTLHLFEDYLLCPVSFLCFPFCFMFPMHLSVVPAPSSKNKEQSKTKQPNRSGAQAAPSANPRSNLGTQQHAPPRHARDQIAAREENKPNEEGRKPTSNASTLLPFFPSVFGSRH